MDPYTHSIQETIRTMARFLKNSVTLAVVVVRSGRVTQVAILLLKFRRIHNFHTRGRKSVLF